MMTTNKFFANVAGKALALAAVVMMSVAFTACSSDDDDKPKPEQTPNTIVLDGVTMPITKAQINVKEFYNGNYWITLFVSEDRGIKILAEKEHHDGKTIDLTKKEPQHDGSYWGIDYHNPELIFDTFGDPELSYPVFMSGTLCVKHLGSEGDKSLFEIVLKNGKVKCEGVFGDGKEHTISISWKGEIDTPQPPTITNTVTVDGKTMPVTKAYYEDGGNGNFAVELYLSDGSYFDIQGNAANHIGKTIDLTKKEGDKVPGVGPYRWYVKFVKDGKTIFKPWGGNDSDNIVFTTGTLRIDGNPIGSETTISLKNGKVTDAANGDGKEHTVSIDWKGTPTK